MCSGILKETHRRLNTRASMLVGSGVEAARKGSVPVLADVQIFVVALSRHGGLEVVLLLIQPEHGRLSEPGREKVERAVVAGYHPEGAEVKADSPPWLRPA